MATYVCGIVWLLASVVAPNSSGVEVLFFNSTNCAPCQQMHGPMQQLAASGVPVHSVDCQQRPDLVQQFKIQNLPTIVVLGGNQEFDRIVGATPFADLKQRVDRVATRFGGIAPATASVPNAVPSLVGSQPPSQGPNQGPVVRGQSPDRGAGYTEECPDLGVPTQVLAGGVGGEPEELGDRACGCPDLGAAAQV
ncbi:MAG: thioredoxin family protein, partial [Planctomycetota bacterium]